MRRINDKFVKYTIRLTDIEEILISKEELYYKVSTLKRKALWWITNFVETYFDRDSAKDSHVLIYFNENN